MNKRNYDELKRRAGKAPFFGRGVNGTGKQPCPIHGGDAGFDMWEKDGMWFATCRSACKKTWDAIAWVMEKDEVDFKTAVSILEGRSAAPARQTEKPRPKEMTDNEWQQWGHPVTADDVARFAASRKDATASVDAFTRLGCQVKDDLIGFPYRLQVEGEMKYFVIKTRSLDAKDIKHEHCVNANRFFNLDTVNYLEPVYVVEGEPDVAIMEDNGFRAVSAPVSGKFSQAELEILKEATHIFLIGDQKKRGMDDPGPKLMNDLQVKLPPEKTSRIMMMDAHDVCQLARQYGNAFADHIKELSEDAQVPWIDKHIPDDSSLPRDPVKWLIDRMLPWGGLTIFCAAQGGQKTQLALYIARAAGRAVNQPPCDKPTFLGRSVAPHRSASDARVPVLYVDRENPKEVIGNRLDRMTDAKTNFQYWGDGDHATPDEDDPRLLDWMRKKKGLIIVDSLQDWYGDAKEIDNAAMVKLMNRFRHLARLGAGVVLLHHVDKFEKSAWRGATSIVSIPDMSISMKRSELDKEVIELREIRFRMCRTWEMDARLRWDDFNHTISLDLVRDQEGTALSEQQAQAKAEKQAQKAKAKQEDMKAEAAPLVAQVERDRTMSALKIEELTGIGRNRVPKLLAAAGWRRNKDKGVWLLAAESADPPTLPM